MNRKTRPSDKLPGRHHGRRPYIQLPETPPVKEEKGFSKLLAQVAQEKDENGEEVPEEG